MKTLLTIDTSAEYCSVGLLHNNKLSEKRKRGLKSHADVILSFIDALLDSRDLSLKDVDLIIFVKGPGSFTGLRICACVAQGLAVANDIGIIGISSLQAIAQGAFRQFNEKKVCVVNDARMNEVYYGKFSLDNNNIMVSDADELVGPLDNLSSIGSDYKFIGSGLGIDNASVPINIVNNLIEQDKEACPQPCDLITIGSYQNALSAQLALPTYIRNNVAKKKRGSHGS